MQKSKPHGRPSRRAMAVPEWFCLIAFIAVVLILTINSVGTSLRGRMNETADGVADPNKLMSMVGRGGGGDSGEDSGTPAASSGTPDSKPKKPNGNNGVGNGEDPQPPGNPPVNDGPGTSPGNPGNKGGAKK